MSSDNFIKLGKMNLISKKSKKEINYVIVPKGYFKIETQNYENKIDKILKALYLDKPEMIFRVPRNYTESEYFIHDFSDNYEKNFFDCYKDYDLSYIIDLSDIIDNSPTGKETDIKWTQKLNQYLIDKLKYSFNEKHFEFVTKLEKIEYRRRLIYERIKTIIRGLSEAFNQANAFLWMEHEKNDRNGDFIANSCIKGTTIIADCILNPQYITDESGIIKMIDEFINTDKDTIIDNPSEFFTKDLFDRVFNNTVDFNEDNKNNINIIDYDIINEINKLETICHNYILNLDESLKEKIKNKGVYWEKCFNGEENWLIKKYSNGLEINHSANYNMIPKDSLTHLIYWQDKNDYLTWVEYLKSIFPLGLLLVGGKRAGFREALECLNNNQPLFVFNGTGGSASIVGNMIKKMQEHCNKIQKDKNYPKKIKLDNFPSEIDSFKNEKKRYFLNSDNFENMQTLSKIMLENWPDQFNKDSVLVIDTISDSVEQLQNKITKTMNAIFEDVPELGGKNDDRKRLEYAWKQYEILRTNADVLNIKGTIFLVILALLTFLTSLVATISSLNNNFHLSLCSVILPLLTGVFLTVFYTFKPIEKWAVCEIGSRMIMGEIYKFRTRTGIYHVSRKKSNKKINDTRAREIFAEELIKIWKLLELSDIKVSSLSPVSNSTIIKDQIEIENKQLNLNVSNDIEMGDMSNEKLDPLEKISVENYVKTRLNMIIDENKNEAPNIENLVKTLQVVIFLLTASGSLLSHLQLSVWVPIVLAFSTMLATIMEQKQLVVKLNSTNGIYMQLEQLKCYWQGLSLIERRKYNNGTYIVENTESIVISQLSAYVQAVKSVNEKDDE